MARKEGKVIATGINPQGVPWKEISYIEDNEKKKEKSNNRKDNKENGTSKR